MRIVDAGLWEAIAAASVIAMTAGTAHAQSLYETSVIVTGMDGRSRPAGLDRALRQVLAKASGNPAWLEDAAVGGIAAAALVQGFAYLDRDGDIPKHDEQGSRDRPYDMVVQFDQAGIDQALRGLGDAPWPLPRPALAIDVQIKPRRGDAFPMRADTDTDERQRAALLAAGQRFGVQLVIPPATDGGVRTWRGPNEAHPVLQGRLAWDDAGFGWSAQWTLIQAGVPGQGWSIRGVGFDAAYRAGVAGAVAALSGHGPITVAPGVGSGSSAPDP